MNINITILKQYSMNPLKPNGPYIYHHFYH